jgi:hypothetical protein
LVEEPDWIPDGDGRALGQQNLDINLSPLHAEQNEYHTSNVFYADEDVQKMTSSEFIPFDQITSEIQQEWDETTAPIAADYEPSNEPTNANFSADSWKVRGEKRLKEEFARNPRCGECGGGTTEETESGVQGTFVYQCQNQDCLWNSWPPHREESRSIGEDEEEYAYEPTDEEMAKIWEREQKIREMEPTELLEDDDYTTLEGTLDAETTGLSKNAQYAIGLAALGVGIALWNGDWVSKMFDRFKR